MIKKVFLSYDVLSKVLNLSKDNAFVAYTTQEEKGIHLIVIDPLDELNENFIDKLLN